MNTSIIKGTTLYKAIMLNACMYLKYISRTKYSTKVMLLNNCYYICSVYGENKTITNEVKWSLDGSRILSVEQDGVARVWRMKVHAPVICTLIKS